MPPSRWSQRSRSFAERTPVNSDFRELLSAFSAEGVEYLLVGAHAVMFYAEPRFTKGIDLWVNPTAENAARVWAALKRFKAPLASVAESDFADADMVYQLGLPPNRIDILMGMDGLTFAEAWNNRVAASYAGVEMHVIANADLIRNKLATARPQDLLDVQRLRE